MTGVQTCALPISDDSQEFFMDVLKCLWFDTCSYFGCPELCEIFCLCDHIVFGNIGKLEFERSQTLGMDGEKIDLIKDIFCCEKFFYSNKILLTDLSVYIQYFSILIDNEIGRVRNGQR